MWQTCRPCDLRGASAFLGTAIPSFVFFATTVGLSQGVEGWVMRKLQTGNAARLCENADECIFQPIVDGVSG